MGTSRKLKISVTLGSDLVANIDRQAAAAGGNRSAVIERLLRRIGREDSLARLQESTAAYYEALTAVEKDEDEAVARASARAARRLVIDAPSSRRRRAG